MKEKLIQNSVVDCCKRFPEKTETEIASVIRSELLNRGAKQFTVDTNFDGKNLNVSVKAGFGYDGEYNIVFDHKQIIEIK